MYIVRLVCTQHINNAKDLGNVTDSASYLTPITNKCKIIPKINSNSKNVNIIEKNALTIGSV